jgi:hypothetical protein
MDLTLTDCPSREATFSPDTRVRRSDTLGEELSGTAE